LVSVTYQEKKGRKLLTILENGKSLDDFNILGYRFHSWSNTEPTIYSMDITGNYRILFTFDGENVFNVDYYDPH